MFSAKNNDCFLITETNCGVLDVLDKKDCECIRGCGAYLDLDTDSSLAAWKEKKQTVVSKTQPEVLS